MKKRNILSSSSEQIIYSPPSSSFARVARANFLSGLPRSPRLVSNLENCYNNNQMSNQKSFRAKFARFSDQTKLAFVGAGMVLKHPRYLTIAILSAVLFALIFTLTSSGSTDWNLLTSSLPFVDKLKVLLSLFVRIWTNSISLEGFFVLLLSSLQGIAISLLFFTYHHQKKLDTSSATNSSIASIIALFGLGCSSCGTSLLSPLLNLFFASSAYILVDSISSIIMIIAFTLSLYAVRRLGYTSYLTITANNHLRKKEKHEI